MKTHILGLVWACALTFVSLPTGASILTFDLPVVNLATTLPSNYGDRITSTFDSTTGFEYGLGNGFTPNITVEYAPIGGGPFTLWSGGYAELQNALGHQSFDVPGEIVFTPDPGFQVRLNSFDIAGWESVGYQTQFAIYDDNGTQSSPNLFSADLFVPGSNSIDPLTTSLVATGPLHIFVSNIGSTGIDNINFDQLPPVPIPAALWFFGSALAGLIGIKRRS